MVCAECKVGEVYPHHSFFTCRCCEHDFCRKCECVGSVCAEFGQGPNRLTYLCRQCDELEGGW
jgi:hypothetical protein